MKYIVSLIMVISMSAVADTTIYYDDGSTYTLEPDQEIYISDKGVYSARGGLKTWLRIIRMEPWTERDWVETIPYDACDNDGLTFGHVNCPQDVEEEESEDNGDFTFGG